MEQFSCVLQYPREVLIKEGFPYAGQWGEAMFRNSFPIVVELGCGRGEYTVGLARKDNESNFIGVDVKGARMWAGARTVENEQITNAAFLRAEIENIDKFFSPGEVDKIWITFPDPQMQKTRKRLTSTRFLNLYRSILRPDGLICLKTDSPFLYEYTRRLVELNHFEVITETDDLYGSGMCDPDSSIKTYYEQQWLARGKKIKLLCFRLLTDRELIEPETDDIPRDDYHSQSRHANMAPPSLLS